MRTVRAYIRKPLTNNDEINITPMMDVVFIMLIFFIVTTSFVKESGIGISGSKIASSTDDQIKIANIKLDNSGYSINGNPVSLEGIEARLSQMKAESPEIKAQLFSAKDIKVATLIRAVEQVKEAQISGLSVSSY
jgi:biopolymer transport protein ExbD